MRIAVLSRFAYQMGGAEFLAGSVLDCLSKAGHDVTLLTFSPPSGSFNIHEFEYAFGKRLNDVKVILTGSHKTDGLTYSAVRRAVGELWANLASQSFDLFVDVSGVIVPVYLKLPDLAYIHYPFVLNYPSKEADQLTPSKLFLGRAYRIAVLRFLKSTRRLFCNSYYTRGIIASIEANANVKVLYPPVPVREFTPECEAERIGVASASRCVPFKKLEEHLFLAKRLKIPVTLICVAKRQAEFQYLSYLKRIAPSNVKFIINASREDVKRVLWRSRVYLSTTRDEQFGIAIVEAIAAGCVPIVRDDGGPREIVPYPELRFGTEDELDNKVLAALAGENDYIRPELQRHIQQFDEPRFQQTFLRAVETL